jgi:hypothetical protein
MMMTKTNGLVAMSRRRQKPTSIHDALKRPALSPSEVAYVTGLSYNTIITDVRSGDLRTLCHRRKNAKRPTYIVPRACFIAYVRQLGFNTSLHST